MSTAINPYKDLQATIKTESTEEKASRNVQLLRTRIAKLKAERDAIQAKYDKLVTEIGAVARGVGE